MSSSDGPPPIVLFGYDCMLSYASVIISVHKQGQIGVEDETNTLFMSWSCATTLKRQARRYGKPLVLVPSMMPRPVLIENFNLTYRKIPVMAIGKELYIDTSLILEVINSLPSYPHSPTHPPLHVDQRIRTLTRLLSSHYTDRPLFRLTTGLIPRVVWQTSFGVDRAGLIGHKLNPDKLGAKVPRNLSALDTYLSVLEPLFQSGGWFLATEVPSAADISLYYQLDWGEKISRGEGIQDLTGGGTSDGSGEGMRTVFNSSRYPNLLAWFGRVQKYFDELPNVETRIERNDVKGITNLMSRLNAVVMSGPVPLLSTAGPENTRLDEEIGLSHGARVSVAPDDTGRDDPTIGTLVGLSPEEVVIVPDLIAGRESVVQGVRVHFPRVGFVVKKVDTEVVRVGVAVKSRL